MAERKSIGTRIGGWIAWAGLIFTGYLLGRYGVVSAAIFVIGFLAFWFMVLGVLTYFDDRRR